jgi:hypothetical protein
MRVFLGKIERVVQILKAWLEPYSQTNDYPHMDYIKALLNLFFKGWAVR